MNCYKKFSLFLFLILLILLSWASAQSIFSLVPERSEVRFRIAELLFGDDKTVVGKTSEFEANITVNFEDISLSELDTVRVNARSLQTDDSFRNRSLRRQILKSGQDEFQFIEFVPTELNWTVQGPVPLGEPLTLSIIGDLSIRGISQSVTFEAEVTFVSETELAASAFTTILREDFELNIPRVPGVANVAEEVKLEIDLVAQTAAGTE